ncbi:hypothetical protein HOA91_02270 [Candidatus Woesearchaeota archaeon]|jgi:hypothetical protein|nr:hypothetical protein [Candidatus Woesearchaeota archaeon]
MATTIQISGDLQQELASRKMFAKETYEEVIWDLIEDTKELSAETLKNIEISKKQIKEGKTHSHEEVKRKLGL